MAKDSRHPLTKGWRRKNTSAYEVAYSLDAVLVDLEHDIAGVTSIWGTGRWIEPGSRSWMPLRRGALRNLLRGTASLG
jgi:hypothetical protein